MAITINGSGTITGISAGGLPDGSVTAADIESSLDLSGKTVTLPSGTGGKVLQVVTAGFSGQTAFSSTSPTVIHGVTITPISASSTLHIFCSFNAYVNGATNHFRIYDTGDSAYIGGHLTHGDSAANWHFGNMLRSDSADSTTSRAYRLTAERGAGSNTQYCGNGSADGVKITIIEVAS